jgi:dihydroorotase
MYSEKEFLGYNICYIIIEVREFKIRVYESMQKLQDLEDLTSELNNKLIQQDMDNATVLLTKKSQKLRERLIAA